jgi:hypothetical protein
LKCYAARAHRRNLYRSRASISPEQAENKSQGTNRILPGFRRRATVKSGQMRRVCLYGHVPIADAL